jgi:hypothetical protein
MNRRRFYLPFSCLRFIIQEIFPDRREDVDDDAPLLQRQHAMLGVGRDIHAVALPENLLHAVQGELESAGNDIADLLVGVPVRLAGRTLGKAHFGQHHRPARGQDLARDAVLALLALGIRIYEKHGSFTSRYIKARQSIISHPPPQAVASFRQGMPMLYSDL